MLLAILLLGLVLCTFQPSECPDVATCRQAALDAAGRGEFETFHDLAWRTVQKGRPNDPELMTLLARAQSLSGRPGDALVMLRRLAQMGVATDAAASDDFRRVRSLPGWPEIEALLRPSPSPPSVSVAPAATKGTGPAPEPAPPERPPNPSAAPEEDALPAPLASVQPAGLAYDAVSRRFIVGDRRANKLVIFDEVFKRATDMVAADSAGFFGLSAIEIDRRRGDLWVANSSAVRGASLHKLQLVSGRVLFELAVPQELGPTTFVDAAVLADGHLLLLDAQGRRLLGLWPAQRAFKRAAVVDVEGATSLAATGDRVAYVAHREGVLRIDLSSGAATPLRDAPAGLLRIRAVRGGLIGVQTAGDAHRIVRLRLDAAGKRVNRIDVLDQAMTMPDPSAMTTVEGSICYITSVNGSPVMRRVKVGK